MAGSSRRPVPATLAVAALGVGAVCSLAYVYYARRAPAPILDLRLLDLPTFRASIFGGFMFRLGIGAGPIQSGPSCRSSAQVLRPTSKWFR